MLPFKCHVACSSSSIPRPGGTYRDGWDLPQPTFAENNLKMMPAWDTIEISEQGEDEQVIKSKIRVPQHLSMPG